MSRQRYCNICPKCGAHLDPGEKCDCEEQEAILAEFYAELEKSRTEERAAS